MLEEDPQSEEIIARVAALDIGKAELVCCVRVPHEGKPGRRCQEVATYSTMTGSLLEMSDHRRCVGVSRVVMEATSDYWKPVFYLLELRGWRCGWSMPRMSSTSRDGRRRTSWTRCGSARSLSGA